MKHIILNKQNNTSIVLFFAGWGMDAHPFQEIKEDGYDYALIYDYSDFRLNLNLEGYTNIHVFAWSFGVFAAAKWISQNHITPATAIAINGTLFPIDDIRGIPQHIFQGTLDNLNERTLMKFNRRMCGSSENYKKFIEKQPNRDITSLRKELVSMQNESSLKYPLFDKWDKAYISQNDLIFPKENQQNGWKGLANVVIYLDEAHFPHHIEKIIISNLINKDLIKQRFEKSLGTYNQYANGQQEIAQKLLNYWQENGFSRNKKIYEIGCGTGLFTDMYIDRLQPNQLLLNDLADIPKRKTYEGYKNVQFIATDAENYTPPCKYDYVVSTSTIQWFENIPLFLNRISDMLEKGGMIVMSTFGPANLEELRDIFSSSLNYPTVESLRKALNDSNFNILHLSDESIVYNFDTPQELLKSIKCTGVNGVKSANPISRDTIKRLKESLPHNDKGYRLTYNPIYIIAQKN